MRHSDNSGMFVLTWCLRYKNSWCSCCSTQLQWLSSLSSFSFAGFVPLPLPMGSLLLVFRGSFGSATLWMMDRLQGLVLGCRFCITVRSYFLLEGKGNYGERIPSVAKHSFNKRGAASMSWHSGCCLLFISWGKDSENSL